MSLSDKQKEYRDIAKKNKKRNYESWLNSQSISSSDDYTDTIADIKAQDRRSSLTYGALGQDLSESGLDASGYADYIRRSKKADYQKLYEKAQYDKYIGNFEGKQGYEKYLSDYNAQQEKLRSDVTETIYSKRIFDLETAYAIAMDAGLSEENALDIITTATREAKNKTCNHVISYARKEQMSASQARAYATSLGLDEKSITYILGQLEISESEEDYYSSLTADQYLKYLQNKYGK